MPDLTKWTSNEGEERSSTSHKPRRRYLGNVWTRGDFLVEMDADEPDRWRAHRKLPGGRFQFIGRDYSAEEMMRRCDEWEAQCKS